MAEPTVKRFTLPLAFPVLIDAPPQMKDAVEDVLAGKYESGFHGEDLAILDIGANVGSFSIWAYHRWPRSSILAYEPHPQTFEMLESNVRTLGSVECVNAAVFPSRSDTVEFFSRYPGDGEAGVAECMKMTFASMPEDKRFDVPVVQPKDLPCADIIKLDVEGAEADIVRNMDLSKVSLILLEFQNSATRVAIKAMLEDRFELVSQDEFPWENLLPGSGYRPDLMGDKYGHMHFIARDNCRLAFVPPEQVSRPPLATRLRRRLRALLRV